jgi:hypothetical protein
MTRAAAAVLPAANGAGPECRRALEVAQASTARFRDVADRAFD